MPPHLDRIWRRGTPRLVQFNLFAQLETVLGRARSGGYRRSGRRGGHGPGVGRRVHSERVNVVHFAIDKAAQREKCIDDRVENAVRNPVRGMISARLAQNAIEHTLGVFGYVLKVELSRSAEPIPRRDDNDSR
jgi:hypothetical protein